MITTNITSRKAAIAQSARLIRFLFSSWLASSLIGLPYRRGQAGAMIDADIAFRELTDTDIVASTDARRHEET